VGVTSRNFTGVWLVAEVIKRTLILQGVPPTKFGRAKNVQNSARFLTNFRHLSRMSPEWIDVTKSARSTTFHLLLGGKISELWFSNKKVIDVNVDPPNWTFSGDYISALRGAASSNFYTPYNPEIVFFSVGLGAPGGLKLGSAPYF